MPCNTNFYINKKPDRHVKGSRTIMGARASGFAPVAPPLKKNKQEQTDKTRRALPRFPRASSTQIRIFVYAFCRDLNALHILNDIVC